MMESTYRLYSNIIEGEVIPHTPKNQAYIATMMVQKWLDEGYSVNSIALMWNQGHAGKCSKGINKHGVAYDSCEYAAAVVAYYKK